MLKDGQLTEPLRQLDRELREWREYLEDLYDAYDTFADHLFDAQKSTKNSSKKGGQIPGYSSLSYWVRIAAVGDLAKQLKSLLKGSFRQSISSLSQSIRSIAHVKTIVEEQATYLYQEHVKKLQQTVKTLAQKVKDLEEKLEDLQEDYLCPENQRHSSKISDKIQATKNSIDKLKNELLISKFLAQAVEKYYSTVIINNFFIPHCKSLCQYYRNTSVQGLLALYQELNIDACIPTVHEPTSVTCKMPQLCFKIRLILNQTTRPELIEFMQLAQQKTDFIESQIEELDHLVSDSKDWNEEKLKTQLQIFHLDLVRYAQQCSIEVISEALKSKEEEDEADSPGMFSCLSPVRRVTKLDNGHDRLLSPLVRKTAALSVGVTCSADSDAFDE